jgi:hypothetical protein
MTLATALFSELAAAGVAVNGGVVPGPAPGILILAAVGVVGAIAVARLRK